MTRLAAFIAAFSAVALIVAATKEGAATTYLLAATALLCAYTTYRSPGISRFLQVFVSIFATETIVFGALHLVAQAGLWPVSLEDYELPVSLPLTVAMFAILVYALSFLPVVRAMTAIADRYFRSGEPTRLRIWPLPSFMGTERGAAVAMVVMLVLINQAQVGAQVRLSFFSRDFFNAIQNKDEAVFWAQLLAVFFPWAFLYIGMAVIEYVVQSTLIIRWRRWLTADYVSRWLDHHAHYHIALEGGVADNPDQRIAEDVNRFIDGGQTGYGIYSFSILLISTLSSLISFAIVLWDLSANFTLPGTTIAVPGFLFWVALIYAGIGTLVTHLIGRPLVALAFAQQRYEADFRFSLARLREYGEQVALLAGEPAEKASLTWRFGAIVTNYFRIISVRKNLTAFTAFYGQMSTIIPYIVAAPFYFAGKVTLGVMTQTTRGFGTVEAALTFFITYYVSLAEFKAVLDRLISFDSSIESARRLERPLGRATATQVGLDLAHLTLRRPDGREIVRNANLHLAPEDPALFVGPSGSGKSTLFRAISGIWPYGEGEVDLPAGARVMLLPQRPYVPIGSLHAAATYPAPPESFTEDEVRDALVVAKLEALAGQLHVEDNWAQRLSGGEQQKLAVARALLARPDWLFLDEATAAMDETLEAEIYAALFKALPETTIVSIGHRASLAQFHRRRIEMKPASGGAFTPVEATVGAVE